MIEGKNFGTEMFKAFNRTVFDLSEATAYEMVLINADASIRINNIYIVWTEGSSADAGIAINIGATATGSDYFTTTSSASKSAGDVETISAESVVVPKGTPIYINHDGGKGGAGNCFVIFSYTTN